MQTTTEFNGLGMPVFMAFGWAGEETAQQYALSQLEAFVTALYTSLPASMQDELPHTGISEESQAAYLAADENVESDVHISFNARPASLEIQLALTNKEALSKGLKQITKDSVSFQRLLMRLDSEWALRIQQIHINEDTGDQGHYQDVFKDSLQTLDETKAVEVFEKAAYLNSDDKWVTPIFLSHRVPAEQAAAMNRAIISVLAERLALLAPIVTMMRGRSARRAVRAATKKGESKAPAPKAAKKPVRKAKAPTAEEFVYISELRPLHIRRGFINMTSEHWPFFAVNARTESRPVTVVSETIRDTDCSVWRLQPNNLARLVLSPRAQRWLEENFASDDNIIMTATKVEKGEIQIILEMP